MSGLARIMKAQKKNISGSDQNSSHTIHELKKEGMKMIIGHHAKNLPAKTEMVIYSSAVPANNPERVAAQKRKIPEFSYPEALGLLTATKATICICGTHGKTTTTAMAAAIFLNAKKDPSVIVGSTIRELKNRNAHNGKGQELIIESCEYRRGFLNYHPQTIIITNVEADHLDYYKNLTDYKKAFLQFVNKLPKNGVVIANHDDKNIRNILKNFHSPGTKIIWYGAAANKNKTVKYKLKIPGEHNIMNANAAATLAHHYKISAKIVRQALEHYQGSSRRFETIGYHGKAIVIDDYGHHPTEIKATLKAAREKFGKKAKILCVFQPHQFSRTHKLLNEFTKSFKDANAVIIPNIFGVRDTAKDLKKINTEKLVKAISKHHKHVKNGNGLEATIEAIKKTNHYDVIITMGAGDVYKVAEQIAKRSIKN